MIKFVAKKNIENGKILNVYSSVKDAANSVNTISPYISQALRLHGNSKGYKWEYIDTDDTEIVEMLNNKTKNNG